MSRTNLQKVAHETHGLIPGVAALRPDAPLDGYLCTRDRYVPLSSRYFPNLVTQVRVVNADTYDAAINVTNARPYRHGQKPVCVLNNANAITAGGGWLRGALAQEEVLCYRSTLIETLKQKHYPMKTREAVYSPTVIIFRENDDNDYRIMDLQKPSLLPVVSVISMAAIYRPAIDTTSTPPRYKNSMDRELSKEKLRVVLRVAVHNGHRSVVLGALGCGAFGHPREEAADCWVDVLQEQEFRGWFQDIVFAVLGKGSTGHQNFSVFKQKLDGLTV
ncbi:hypothetical protein BJX70DRAFT_95796 [Aspergillus crustosus]